MGSSSSRSPSPGTPAPRSPASEPDARPDDPRSGGLFHALWLLARGAEFEAIDPTAAALRYDTRRGRGIAPLCDVYVPGGRGPHPSVVVVHGGGFVLGNRRMKPVRLLATRLCQAGYAVCSVDYRLLLRGGGLDAQLADVDAAARFWRSQCERFDCDPERISIAGFSAGAVLTMLHAGGLAARGSDSSQGLRYRRVVSFYGASELGRVSGRRAALLLRAVFGTSDREQWVARSPAAVVARMPTPMLLIHGTADQLVPMQHSTRLHERRLEHGVPSELALYDGMPHGWLNDASLPETDHAVERVLSFLEG